MIRVGTRADSMLCPVINNIIYVVIKTQIRYMTVLTRLRVGVSWIILYIPKWYLQV
jgi:hypothetical protein